MIHPHHTEVDRAITTIHDTDLDELGRQLHTLIELNRDHPSTPDGFPATTSGASPSTSRRPVDDDSVDLTSVEAAADARPLHRDPLLTAERRARQALTRAAHNLDTAQAHLRHAEQLRHTTLVHNPEPGCWIMHRIGAWEPIHRVTDFTDIFARPLDEPRAVGRWAYDFARRVGRLPTIDECRRHQRGDKVMVAA